MPSIEEEVKRHFARLFVAQDAVLFKEMAEYYFRRAAFLKMGDVDIRQPLRRLARNCQKRLFLGIGTELLLKAIYLRCGYSINELKNNEEVGAPGFPFKFQQIGTFEQLTDRTFMMDRLIAKLGTVLPGSAGADITRGLKIAKVFRNKEGHVVLPTHLADDSNYRDIEKALSALYQQAFKQSLNIRVSFRPHEKPVWRVS